VSASSEVALFVSNVDFRSAQTMRESDVKEQEACKREDRVICLFTRLFVKRTSEISWRFRLARPNHVIHALRQETLSVTMR